MLLAVIGGRAAWLQSLILVLTRPRHAGLPVAGLIGKQCSLLCDRLPSSSFFVTPALPLCDFTISSASARMRAAARGGGKPQAACLVPSRLGRAQTTLLTRLADILLLVAMAFTPPGSTGRQAGLVAMHLVRTAMANCTRPLLRSLLMDHVPKRHRGKVNALDSVRTLSWSGSAALGGCVAYFSCTTCWAAPVVLLRRVMVDKFCVDRCA